MSCRSFYILRVRSDRAPSIFTDYQTQLVHQMDATVRRIARDDELIAAARLRYDVAVTEMGLSMRYADHDSKTVVEPLDSSGHVFGAWVKGMMVGTLRTNLLRESDVGFYYDAYGIPRLPESIDRRMVSVTTRLAVERRFRGGRIPLLLPLAAFRFLISNGITHDVIDSRAKLVPFFRRLGYREHIPSLAHPEFGDVVVQVLSFFDESHLAAVSSPFLKPLEEHLQTKVAARQFSSTSTTNPQ